MNTLKKSRKLIISLLIAFCALFIVFGSYKYIKAAVGGYGVMSATITDDNGNFDLLANNGTTNYPTFSNNGADAYSAQIVAKFPTGANITNKQIHVVAPVGLVIDRDGTGITQTTNQLVGGNAGITRPTTDSWINYGVTLPQGRLYQVKTIANGLDISDMTINLTLHRNDRVRAQTLTNLENHFQVIVSWEENGVKKSDTIDVGGLNITGLGAAGNYGSTLSIDPELDGTYRGNISLNGTTVGSGKPLAVAHMLYLPGTSSTVSSYVDSASTDITVTYTPVGGTAQLDTVHTLTIGSSSGAASAWSLVNNGDGTYKLTRNNTPGNMGGGGFYYMLDLTDPSLQDGDKITISYAGIESHLYSGLTQTTGPLNTTWTIRNEADIRLTNVGIGVSITPDASYGGSLYAGRISNAGGTDTPSQDINIDMSNANGITGISPSLMTLPLESGKTLTSINYTLVDGTTGTLTGSWTGSATGMITLTMADWKAAGLSDTSYLKNINYTMGILPGNYGISTQGAGARPQGQISLYGRWLDDSVKNSQIQVTFSNTDGTGTPLTSNLTNTLGTPNAVIYFSDPATQIQNAGYRYNFSMNATTSTYADSDGSGIMQSPVFYIRNESAGDLDMSSIKLVQANGNVDITSQCEITDMGVINGAHVYKVDTAKVTSNNGQDAWLGTVPYYYDSNGVETVDKNFTMTISYSIQTYINTPNSERLMYYNMIFVGHNDDPLLARSQGDGNSRIITDTYGMTDPAVTDLVAMNPNRGNGAYTHYYQIVGKLDMIPYFEAKQTGTDDTTYTNLQGSAAIAMSDQKNVDVRLSITNPSGVTLEQGKVLIPIPKKGQNWGAYSNNQAFPFTLNLTGPISNPDSSKFTIMYGTATPGTDGAVIDANTSWETYNAAHANNYNVIRVVCDGLPFIDPGSSDATVIQAANTWPLNATLKMPFDASISDGTIAAWTPLYYEKLTIPGTGPGTGPISGWQTAGPLVGVQTMLGELGGKVWTDPNHDGTWATSESVVNPGNDWQVYLFKSSDFKAADFNDDPATWLSANESKLIAKTVTNSSGQYYLDLLNRNESYALVSLNKDQSKYWYTVNGTDMSLDALVVMDTSQTPNITNHPYATNPSIQAGTHILSSDGSWDQKGVYDIGLYEKNYTVKYDTNGGLPTSIADKTKLGFTEDNLLPSEPTRAGYDFGGWNVTAGGSGNDVQASAKYSELVPDDLTMSITLTAQWSEKADITINYVSESITKGTVSLASETLAPVNGTVAGSTATANQGYSFVNWTNSQGNVVATNPHLTPAKVDGLNVAETYTAHFKANNYAITYVLNGGTNDSSNPSTYSYGIGVSSFAKPTKKGYKFLGWVDRAGNSFTNISTTDIGDKVLVAKWEKEAEQMKTKAPIVLPDTGSKLLLIGLSLGIIGLTGGLVFRKKNNK